jgi:hypothetical protein
MMPLKIQFFIGMGKSCPPGSKLSMEPETRQAMVKQTARILEEKYLKEVSITYI